MSPEEPESLAGGNASGVVVRIGDTVRKPWSSTTPRTVAFLEAVRDRGIDAPEPLGRDDDGRLVLRFVPGTLALDLAPLDVATVRRVGALLRHLHDASADLPVPDDWLVTIPPPGPPDLVCHNDVATWNLLVDGDRLVLIDWDAAGPSTRLWDLAYAATAVAHLFDDEPVDRASRRLAAFVDGYDADDALRAALPRALVDRSAAMLRLLEESAEGGREPWASMCRDGHGEHWRRTTEHLARHERAWARATGL